MPSKSANIPPLPQSSRRSKTEPDHRPPPPWAARRAAHHTEIARDAQLVAEHLRDALRLIAETELDLEELWTRVDEAVAASRAAYRALNNARITLRADRNSTYDDSAPLPAPLSFFRHHGNYHGALASMTELDHCLRSGLELDTDRPPPALARELHVRGDIWTLDHEGAVHVFARPGSDADRLLARERPPPEVGQHLAAAREAPNT